MADGAGLLLVPQHGPWPMAPGVAHGAGLLLSVPEHGPWPMAPGVTHGARPAGVVLVLVLVLPTRRCPCWCPA